MDLLLIHVVLLVWLSFGAARKWTDRGAQCILAAGALAWINLIATALFLSPWRLLNNPFAMLATSASLALIVCFLAWRAPRLVSGQSREAPAGFAWHALVLVPVAGLALVNILIAAAFMPSRPDAITHELPRAFLQAGGGSILPLHMADARQVLLPFNHGLLQTCALVYQPALHTLNFLSLAAWGFCGLAVYQAGRHIAGASAESALTATCVALLATPVLAYANTADPALPVAAALLGSLVFSADWAQRRSPADATFAGLLAGLAAGSRLDVMVVVLTVVCIGAVLHKWPREHRRLASIGLSLGLLPVAINLALSLYAGLPALLASLLHSMPGPGSLDISLLRPMWSTPGPLEMPTEDTVGWGTSGLAGLLAAVWAIAHVRGTPRVGYLAVAAIAWLTLDVLACRWLRVDSGTLFPAFLLTAPALAAGLDRCSSFWRIGVAATLVASGAWSGFLYLAHNAGRSLASISDPSAGQSHAALFPALLLLRISQEPTVNFSSNGEDPLLYMLMSQQQKQRYSAQGATALDNYNLISRASAEQERSLRQLSDGPAYLLIGFPEKPTSGVEFLGRAGVAARTRDYFGIARNAARKPSGPTDCYLLVTLAETLRKGDYRDLRAEVFGLNSQDRAQVEISGVRADGRRQTLFTTSSDGAGVFQSAIDFQSYAIQIIGQDDKRTKGEALLTDPVISVPEQAERPDPRRLFIAQLVNKENTAQVKVSAGLTSAEGPFPQWQLPLIRWARAEKIELNIPSSPDLKRVRLRLSARLHVRTHAILAITVNGETRQRIEFNNSVTWDDAALEFDTRPGENVIELRDEPLPPEPDWADYIDRYPDVKRSAELNRISLREGAISHYNLCGKQEGRTMHFVPVPPPPADSYFFMFRQISVEGLRE